MQPTDNKAVYLAYITHPLIIHKNLRVKIVRCHGNLLVTTSFQEAVFSREAEIEGIVWPVAEPRPALSRTYRGLVTGFYWSPHAT